MSEDWLKRRYVADDESAVVALWLKAFAHARHNVARGANVDGSDAERAYWREHAPVVEFLLQHAEVWVACDPERATYEPGRPAVIFGFAAVGPGDVVHQLVIKRKYAPIFGAEVTRDLLDGRLDKPQVCSHELPEMRPGREGRPARCGVSQPSNWVVDEHWLARQFLPRRAA